MSKLRNEAQTKEAKENYKSPIIELLLSDEPRTRQELMKILHTSDRQVRNVISTCKAHYPVISTSDKKGYRRAKDFTKLNCIDLQNEIDEVQHQINETRSRIKCLKKTLKPLIAWLSKAEKELIKKECEFLNE